MANSKVDVENNENKSLGEQAKGKKDESQLFGTFAGVFTPTLLTILGVIMFLRLGWVVGNAGLLGSWGIILLSFGITTCTALSLSSITTNIRIGAGGAFSVISQSLGLEVGGSIGVPLYLSQTLAVAMYIFGFRSGWQWLFPNHPAIFIDLITFFVLFTIAFISANFAFKIQHLILGIIGISLLSVGIAAFMGSMHFDIQWIGKFPGSPENDFSGIGFWAVFAVFFPASTGIMAGANMSGELKNPRKNIPLGTMTAIGVSVVIYLVLAYWLARSASVSELIKNYTVMIDKAAWGPAVLIGLLGATFSSALSSIVGAPRILQALGNHNILPKGEWFARKSINGEPRNALFLTGAIVLAAIMLRDLNVLAPLITMFFLITYTMINVVVLIEQSLQLVSFRPMFRIPNFVSLVGALGCIFAMFIINPTFSIVAVAIVLLIHGLLLRRHLNAPFGDVRSGLFEALAEWAAKKVHDLTLHQERTWKANLLLPIENTAWLDKSYSFVKDICYPKGFLKIIGLADKEDKDRLIDELSDFTEGIRKKGIFASWTVITVSEFSENLKAGIQTFGSTFFKPNIILLQMPEDPKREDDMKELIKICRQNEIGVLLFDEHPVKGMGKEEDVNLWFENQGPEWDLDMELDNQDLAILIAYKLKLNWEANLRMIAELESQEYSQDAKEYLSLVAEMGRIPNVNVFAKKPEAYDQLPKADLQVIPLPEEIDFEELRAYKDKFRSSCLFTLDSGDESALA